MAAMTEPNEPAPAPADPRFARPRTLVFGIGAQKAATSWLDDYLRGHPEVCLPVRKEQHYWNTMYAEGISKRRARVERELARIGGINPIRRLLLNRDQRAVHRAWRLTAEMLRAPSPSHGPYADVLFQAYGGEPVAGEITPEYALLPEATFRRMAALAPDVRFLFVMRDPIGRTISGARQTLKHGDGEAAVTASGLERRIMEATAAAGDLDVLRSRYDLTIRRLEAVVPRERVCYFFYETLFRQDEIDRLADFLGIGRRAASFGTMVNVSPVRDLALSPEAEGRLVEALAPAYAFVRDRFGGLVPEAWRGAPA
jgi:hypothetical protein